MNLPAFCRLSLLFLSTSLSTLAQDQIQISGQVKDEESKETLPYCKVIALAANDSIVQGGITDDKGFFKLPLSPGQYRIVTSAYGYENDTLQTKILREDDFLGVIRLKINTLDLETMKVQASSRIDLLDRDVQVVTDDQKLGSTAAKDVLNKMPGISYDEYTGRLKVDNDANILVLVNGVEKSQEYVQNLEPERLLRVETVRDPGGRYGLEGYSAIVNVILKNDYKGTEVYIEGMQLVDINTDRKRLDWMIASLGATYNFTVNNLNVYGNAYVQRRAFNISSESETLYADSVRVLEKTGSDPNALIRELDVSYDLGFDYKFNPKHQLSFETNIRALPASKEQNKFAYSTDVYSNDSLVNAYDFNLNTKSETNDLYGSLFYLGELNARNKINVNFAYSNYANTYANSTLQQNVYDRVEAGIDKRQYTRFYAEYDHTFSAKTSIQFGYGNTWRELRNKYDVVQRDLLSSDSLNFSSQFQLNDMRHKLYSNFSWKMSKKWGLMIGVAGESSSPRTSGKQLHYFIYQPMLDLKYAAGKAINFRLKYRVSSAYPGIDETNPFTSQINPRMTSTGNAFLKPTTTHEFSLRVNILNGLLSLEPYSHYSNSVVVQVGELDTDGIFNFRYENAKLYQRNGVEMNFSKFFKFSMLIQANLDLYHANMVTTSGSHSLMDWRADIDLIYIFQKTETLLGLKFQRQQSKDITGLGYQKGDVDFWMLFYKQPLFKKKASIMFGYFLPIDFAANYNQDSHVSSGSFSMQSDNDVSLVKNMFLIELSYRFSKGDSVKKTEKKLLKESEKSNGGMF